MKLRNFFSFFLNLSFLSAALICLVGSFAFDVQAQKKSRTAKTENLLLAEAGDLDQCRNGKIGDEVDCSGNAWVNGNLGAQNSHYKEGDSVPYRYKLTGLTPNTPNQITIEYDQLHSGKHAIDYLTTFNRTETTADPCSDILSAALCASPNTFPIPIDPNVVNGNLTGNQIPGVFTLYGGIITSVSGYTTEGANQETSITIFFTPTVTNPVLAVGGHIATRADWGAGNSAIAISGSPYHMRLIDLNGSGGNQDRSLKVEDFSTSVTIIKDVANGTSTQGFGFTSTTGLPSAFILTDDENDNSIGSTPRGISSGDLSPSGSITVTEDDTFGTGFQLSNIVCTGTDPANISITLNDRQVTVNVQNDESVICTFTNTLFATTAAGATLSGRLVNSNGRGISRAKVFITDSEGTQHAATTNSFGSYRFNDLETGKTYTIGAAHKQYTFTPVAISLTDNITGVNLIARSRD